jgi:hypothetical protein
MRQDGTPSASDEPCSSVTSLRFRTRRSEVRRIEGLREDLAPGSEPRPREITHAMLRVGVDGAPHGCRVLERRALARVGEHEIGAVGQLLDPGTVLAAVEIEEHRREIPEKERAHGARNEGAGLRVAPKDDLLAADVAADGAQVAERGDFGVELRRSVPSDLDQE